MARSSAQNWDQSQKNTPIGGRNFQPDAMNPDLWPVFNEQGQRRINARIRPENTRLMGGGLDAFKLVNSPWGKQMGLGYKQAESAVQSMRSKLSDPNQALFNLNPYAPQAPVATQPQGPTPDQMRWAQAFANTQPAATPAAPAVSTPFTTGLINNALRSNYVQQNPVLASTRGEMNKGVPTPQSVAPTNFSRAALIEGAKRSGEFNDIMNAYNRNAAGTGYRMDDKGNIAKAPETFRQDVLQPAANDIAARRDFARGEAPVQFSTKFTPIQGPEQMTPGRNSAVLGTLPPTPSFGGGLGATSITTGVKQNPYGSASVTYGTSRPSGGMMKHEITGKMVPMSPYLAEKRAIQDTKLGAKPLGAQDANRFRDLIRKGKFA